MKKTNLPFNTLQKFYKNSRRSLLIVFLFLMGIGGQAQQLLIGWDATSNGGGFGASPWTPVTLNPGISVTTGLSRGANLQTLLTPAGLCWGAGGGGWGTTDAGSVYFVFTPNMGSQVSLSSISACLRRSNTGPVNCNVEFSINGGAYTVVGSWATNITSGTAGQANSSSLASISSLQNITAGTVVRFRITYPGGAGGNWYVTNGTNCLRLSGTISTFAANIAQTASIQCNGQSVAALTASVSGSIPPYTYSWMPSGGTSSVATGLAAGVYTCMVTSSAPDTTYSTFTVTQPAALSPSVSAQTSVTCYGGSNASASLAVSGGMPAYTYTWLPSAAGTGSTAANLPAGIYTVTITDANACVTTQTVSIIQPSVAAGTASASSPAICNGATVTLNGNGANTYTWTSGVIDAAPFSPSATAVYTVTGTNTLTGCINMATVSIIVYPNPTVTAVSNTSNTAVCNGSTLALSGAGASTYTWSGNILNGVAFSPSVSATYTVTGTDTSGCKGLASFSLTMAANPTITAFSSKSLICKFESVTLIAGGGQSYTWNNGATTANTAVSPTITTTYTVTGQNASGCSSKATVTQFVSSCLAIEAINANDSQVIIFPNPNNGEFSIKVPSATDLSIVNELGQSIQQIQLNESNHYELTVSSLPQGIYFIIGAGDGFSVKQKVIVTNH